ncbi:hypothetical protein [Flavobacterium sp. GP15]|uniref:hypothetical protein n=1 Tax=Flavobacterium sp. GP15 TaxID=2758567 RepID=UPI00165D89E6|nr:hypothetical protein [Flavobacterium sp. GP15]
MKALTNQDYYNILIEATKEAFESIELKEFLYSNEAMEDNKAIFISQDYIEQIGIKKSNDLIVNSQINKNIVFSFLRFLDRQQLIINKSYLIERNDFFKRCLDVINVKLTELDKNEKNRVLRGLSDMGTPPETLEFLEYVKFHIKNRVLQPCEIQEIPAIKTKLKKNKPTKTLFDFIHNVEDKEAFIQDLKNEFPNDKGKTIKAVINILKEWKIIIIIDRQFKTFYDLLLIEFNGTIGTYPSINDAEKKRPFDKIFLDPIKQKLNPLIIKHKIE